MVSLLSQSVADRPLLLQGCGGTIGQDRPKVKKGKKRRKKRRGRGGTRILDHDRLNMICVPTSGNESRRNLNDCE